MNTIKQIEILFYVTIIEHIIMISIVVFLLIKKWLNSYSSRDRQIDNVREEVNEIKHSIENLRDYLTETKEK